MGGLGDRAQHPDLLALDRGGHRVGGAAGAGAAVGPLDRGDGPGAGRDGCAGHDPGGLAGAHGGEFTGAGGDVADHGQHRGVRVARADGVGRAQGVAVHRAVVEGGQVALGDDVLGQPAALRVEQLELDGGERADGGQDVREVLVHGPQTVRTGTGAGGRGRVRGVVAAGCGGGTALRGPGHGHARSLSVCQSCSSEATNSRSQVRNSGPRSSRSEARRTIARR